MYGTKINCLILMGLLLALSGCATAESVLRSDLRRERKEANARLALLKPGMTRRDVAQIVGPEFAGNGAKNSYRITTSLGRLERLVLSENFQVVATFSVERLAELDQRDDEGSMRVDRMMGLSEPMESDTLIAIGEELQPRQ